MLHSHFLTLPLSKKQALKGLTGWMKQVDLKSEDAELNKTSLDDGNGGRINYKWQN